MKNTTAIYLKFGKKLKIPVNPEMVEIKYPSNDKEYDVLGIGKVTVQRRPGLKEASWNSFFPGDRSAPYVNTRSKDPEDYVKQIERAMKRKKKGRLIISRSGLYDTNMRCTVSEFKTTDKGGEPKDIYYSITLKEYRDFSPQVVSIVTEPGTQDKENESCMDIIFDALSQTIVQTGKIYNFYDDCGKLTLKEAKNMFIQTMIGDRSLVTDYTYKRDIDSDTYNRIKLVRKNKESGRTDAYVHEDTDTIKTWGLLQYYDEVDENLNAAQIDEMCKQYLQYYNRVLQTITIDAIGVPGLRAGMIIPVKIGAINELSMVRLMLAEKVTHTFDDGGHTMSIEVKDFSQLGGMSVV